MFNFINNMNIKQRAIKRIRGSSLKPNNLIRGTPPPAIQGSKTVSLFSQPYLDTYNQCYKNIVTINLIPQGPLAQLVRRVQFPPLSQFKQPGPCSRINNCGLALTTLNSVFYNNLNKGCSSFMVVDEVPNLMSFLLSNGYSINTSITKMLNTSDIRFETENANKIICVVTYNG